MIGGIQNIARVTELRQRILFTFGMLGVYRLGAYVVTPGIQRQRLRRRGELRHRPKVLSVDIDLGIAR